MDYMMIDTYGAPGGGMMKRPKPANYKLHRSAVGGRIRSEVEKLGGKIIVPKSAVPGMGYFIICMDTENNAFGIWETNSTAK